MLNAKRNGLASSTKETPVAHPFPRAFQKRRSNGRQRSDIIIIIIIKCSDRIVDLLLCIQRQYIYVYWTSNEIGFTTMRVTGGRGHMSVLCTGTKVAAAVVEGPRQRK